MATEESTHAVKGPAKPSSKEDVIAMLNAFKEHIDAGGGLGHNEEGDEFVEIQEEWDAQGNIISQEALGAAGAGGGSAIATSLREITEVEDEDDYLDKEEEEIEFDDDAFESMMQEMEKLESAAEKTAAAAAAEETSKSTGKSAGGAVTSPGMKRGFLLPSGEQKSGTTPADKKETSTPAPTVTRPTAFTGAVVERQPHTAVISTSNSNIDNQQEPAPPQRVSKFKQRMYGGDSY